MRGLFCLIFISVVLNTGCSSLKIVLQAAKGQLKLSNRTRPISEVVKSDKTPERVKGLLNEINSIKKFGEENGLRKTSNYQDYVEWDDDAVVWVVSACKTLKFEPKSWSFPVIGSLTYIGWFDREDADEQEEELKNEGWDVYVRGASAYSTLGWFRDPVLSTMFSKGDRAMGDLVNVILHESVHATIYLSHQSYFNESLASFAGDKLTLTYLKKRFGIGSKQFVSYKNGIAKGAEKRKRMQKAYVELNEIYSGDGPDDQKLTKKKIILENLKKELKLKRAVNNATLIQYKTYRTSEKDFEKVYESCGKNWNRFWAEMGKLKDNESERFKVNQMKEFGPVLIEIVKRGCQV